MQLSFVMLLTSSLVELVL